MADTINYAELAYKQYQANEELELQKRIVKARDLYEGTIDSAMIDELETALLSGDASGIPALYNVYAMAVDEIADRLSIIDLVDIPEPRPNAPDAGVTRQWAMDYWQQEGLDRLQYDLYEEALVSGAAFLLLGIETGEGGIVRVKPYLHQRYTDAKADGTNEGVKVHYFPNTEIVMSASKRWIETYTDDNGRDAQRQRMTLYIAGTETEKARIEKYVIINNVPTKFQEQGKPWPEVWTDGSGNSLPLPVIPFRAISNGRPAGHRAQGPQYVLDNMVTVWLAAAGAQMFPMTRVIGGFPTTDGKPPASDGSNLWKLGPKQIIGFPLKKPSEASIDHAPPGDLSQILLSIDKAVIMTALTTGTPSLIADQLARRATSAEFLKQVDVRPTARTRKQQQSFGASWTAFFETLARVSNTFAVGAERGNMPEEEPVHVRWLPADIRGLEPGDGDEAAQGQQQQGAGTNDQQQQQPADNTQQQ